MRSLPKYLYDVINTFNKNNENYPFKLAILHSLNIAPGNVIAEIRNLRHKVEHECKIPDRNQTQRAIEIAELFINATDNKLNSSLTFQLTDYKHEKKINDGSISGIYFDFDYDEKHIELRYYDRENDIRYKTKVTKESFLFIAILRMFMSFSSESIMLESLRYFFSQIEITTMPLDKVRIKEFGY